MSVGIYLIRNLVNDKKYVGLSIRSAESRIQVHLTGRGSKLLKSAVNKYGIDNFESIILEECSEDIIKDRERFWISELNTLVPNGYNLTTGGEGLEGWHFSEEVRLEMSRRTTEQRTGTHHTQETKQKISQGRKGKKNTEEAILRMITAASKRFTAEVCQKISDSKTNPTAEVRYRISLGQKKRFETQDNPFKGKHHTEETKALLSSLASKRIGELNPFYGKSHSEEVRQHLSEVKSSQNKGRVWCTNGVSNKFIKSEDVQEFLEKNLDWSRGRIIKK